MNTSVQPTGGSVSLGSPIDSVEPRIPLYTAEFAADPHRVYREMRRRFGTLVPIERPLTALPVVFPPAPPLSIRNSVRANAFESPVWMTIVHISGQSRVGMLPIFEWRERVRNVGPSDPPWE